MRTEARGRPMETLNGDTLHLLWVGWWCFALALAGGDPPVNPTPLFMSADCMLKSCSGRAGRVSVQSGAVIGRPGDVGIPSTPKHPAEGPKTLRSDHNGCGPEPRQQDILSDATMQR
jgi:hypothetical protein